MFGIYILTDKDGKPTPDTLSWYADEVVTKAQAIYSMTCKELYDNGFHVTLIDYVGQNTYATSAHEKHGLARCDRWTMYVVQDDVRSYPYPYVDTCSFDPAESWEIAKANHGVTPENVHNYRISDITLKAWWPK